MNGIASNGEVFTAAPTLSSLSPTSGGVGTAVTITGTELRFDAGHEHGEVQHYDRDATELEYEQPVGADSDRSHDRKRSGDGGGVASNGESFTVVSSAPGITSISPASGAAGTAVTISGSGFGSPQGSSTLTFNGVAPSKITSWAATAIQAQVPTGGVPGPVVVTVNGIASNPFTYTAPAGSPTITSLSLTQGPPQMGLVITGTNFAPNGANQVTVAGPMLRS